MKQLLLLCLMTLGVIFTSNAQVTTVQSFTYDSVSRSMMVDFPEGDHLKYEKILMYYSMRCKDGLISTGADRNKGCGEWDYSCNTYLTDSTKVDSFRATGPSHVILGYEDDIFDYSNDPTFSYYQSTLKEVNFNTQNEINTVLDAGSDMVHPFGDQSGIVKSQFLYKQSDLTQAGLSAGSITGIRIPVVSGSTTLPRLQVRIAQVDYDELDGSSIDEGALTEVFYDDLDVNGSEMFLPFYQTFNWNGSTNLLVEISYHGATNNDLEFEGGSTDYASSFVCDGDEIAALYSEGGAYAELQNDFSYSGDEISISFWLKGGESLPTNSTLFEARDANGNRQANLHMTWGDGNLYWDCGNDGSGYDRVSKKVDEFSELKVWNHWTLTKNATTGFMRVYLNGEPWTVGLNKRKSIQIDEFYFGQSFNGNLKYYGSIDNFLIYDKELTAAEIKSSMYKILSPDDDLYNHVLLAYYFNMSDIGQGVVEDVSSNNHDANILGDYDDISFLGRFLRTGANVMKELPDMTFVSGGFNSTSVEVSVLDSLENSPYFIQEYEVVDNSRVLVDEYSYFLAGFAFVYDENGDVFDVIQIPADGTITIEELVYYTKRPSKLELMSFVTPYGIGIDFGLEGKTWVFDVTDFGPVLKGRKRLSLERGGQNQEEMDIRFMFVEGTPVRDVHAIQQVWPVTSENFTRIMNDVRFEERTVTLSPDAEVYALKAVITGHGQEGEFIPRTHYLNVNGGPVERQWSVWTECADNPVYPQGGTWIYDRAGWCPGAPSDVETVELEDVDPGDEVTIDYGVNSGSGDSRYIVNVQLVSYGEPNFDVDATMDDIVNPSMADQHLRFNPMCGVPKVIIKNTGRDALTSATIHYGVEGRGVRTYQWTGNLDFLETQEVELPALNIDQTVAGLNFFARIENPNGASDQYEANNEKQTVIPSIAVHNSNIVVEMRTNSAANETSWRLFDGDGNLIDSRIGGLSSNTMYRDTFLNLNGCYQLLIEDTDDDGISFWANNDGNGVVQVRDINGGITQVATDFGKFISYEFVTEGYVPVANTESLETFVDVYPNPGFDLFTLNISASNSIRSVEIFSNTGERLMQLDSDQFEGNNSIEFNMENYPAGIYFVQVKDDKQLTTKKFMKL